jgi:tetraacyldisaccharide 4'-kinase
VREPAFWYRPSSLTSRLLTPLAAIYGAVAGRRMRRQGFDAGLPVICVGNYHVGGAGKTPTVLAVARMLRDIGETPVVLSRGYGGRLRGPIAVNPDLHLADDVGDEPLMMAETVPVVVARDRIAGAALARAQGASVVLMDDGFQNPAIAKDASLIVIDGDRGLGNSRVLPAGPLRAPLPLQLARTDALVVVGDGTNAATVVAAVTAGGRPVLSARIRADEGSVATLHGRRVLAFAGIGDPGRFFKTLRENGIEMVRARAFADHHVFSQAEIENLIVEGRRDGLTLVTTTKDLARLRIRGGLPDWAEDIVPFAVTLAFDDAVQLRKLVVDKLSRARAGKSRANSGP